MSNNIIIKNNNISFQSIYNSNNLIYCPICFEETTENYINECNHGMCLQCFQNMINKGYDKCPLCRASLDNIIEKTNKTQLDQNTNLNITRIRDENRNGVRRNIRRNIILHSRRNRRSSNRQNIISILVEELEKAIKYIFS